MSKAVKLKNSLYLASTSIVHKRGGGWYYLNNLLDNIYPVGSIFISTVNTNPSTYFGGTWVQLKDRFLLGAGSTYSNGATGGEATHKLTVDELPKHNHDINYGSTAGGDGSGFRFSNTTGKGSYFMGYAGGDKAHNNMPPYLVVYMWKRKS